MAEVGDIWRAVERGKKTTPSGHAFLGDLTWGGHFGHFYETAADLVDFNVPYFKAGLENEEACFWVTAPPLDADEATAALRAVVPDLDQRLRQGQIEIVDIRDYHARYGKLDPKGVRDSLLARKDGALARGYTGLRASGNTYSVKTTADEWRTLTEYEALLHSCLHDHRIVGICSYHIHHCSAADAVDMVRNHQFMLARRHGSWEVIETAAYKASKESLNRANEELESRVVERTLEIRESERQARELLEALPAAVYTTDAAGRITFYNQAAARLAGRTPTVGKDEWCVTWRLFKPDGTPLPHDECPMAVALKENRPIRGEEIVAERPDGKRVPVIPYPTPIHDDSGALVGAVNMLVDISERKAAEAALRVSEAELVRELAAIKELQRISTELIRERDVRRLYSNLVDAAATIMRSDFATMQMLHPDRGLNGELQLLAHRGFDPEAIKFWNWVRADSGCTCGFALKTGKRGIAADVATCDFMAGTPDRDALLQAGIQAAQSTPLFSQSGRLLGMISTHWRKPHSPSENDLRRFDILARLAADLIERKLNEEQIMLLGREAEHRAKNALATVQATVRLTHAASLEEYKDALEGRLRALANAHTLFAQSGWAGAELRSLVLQELLPYGQARIDVNGADMSLEPNTAQTLALCLHELTTNAAKYGALSAPSGRVRVEWSRSPERRVSLRWSESGGPLVKPPTRRGFGTKMLEAFMQKKGTIRLDWRPQGLRCEIALPGNSEAATPTPLAAE